MALNDGIRFANGVGLVAMEIFRCNDNPSGLGYNLLAQERTALVSDGRTNTIGVTGGGFMDFGWLDTMCEDMVQHDEEQLWREMEEELPGISSVMSYGDYLDTLFPIRGGQFSVKMGSRDRFGNNIHCCSFFGLWLTTEKAEKWLALKGSSETKRLVRRRMPDELTFSKVQAVLPDLYHEHEARVIYSMLRFAQGSHGYGETVRAVLR
ncbi:MAG: hypothetical protein EBQ80_03385 [Proteobacteria bacterium]|nr:hypothetical protein [Pseudomonadota bacterium]